MATDDAKPTCGCADVTGVHRGVVQLHGRGDWCGIWALTEAAKPAAFFRRPRAFPKTVAVRLFGGLPRHRAAHSPPNSTRHDLQKPRATVPPFGVRSDRQPPLSPSEPERRRGAGARRAR